MLKSEWHFLVWETGNVYTSQAHGFSPDFMWVRVANLFCFLGCVFSLISYCVMPITLNCSFLIPTSVFPNGYLQINYREPFQNDLAAKLTKYLASIDTVSVEILTLLTIDYWIYTLTIGIIKCPTLRYLTLNINRLLDKQKTFNFWKPGVRLNI